MANFKNIRTLILGAGKSGRGAEEALIRLGALPIILDEKCGDLADYDLAKFNLIVVSPSVAKGHPIFFEATKHNIEVISEIELGFRMFSGNVVGITGTNGKTTVTELIDAMLKADGVDSVACGNIGVSFSLIVATKQPEVAVVETSSFQLENVSTFKPKVACITNIAPDHLDRHKTFDAYIEAKHNITIAQDETDFLILSQDDIPLFALEGLCPKSNVFYTSIKGRTARHGAYVLDEHIWFCNEKICATNQVRLRGEHNTKNVLIAVCAVKLLGASNKAIIDVLTSFQSGDHRIKEVTSIEGKYFFNDSKGTNIHATLRACEAMSGATCLILGGSDKGYEFDEIFLNLPQNIRTVYAIGQTTQKILNAAKRCGFSNIYAKSDLKEAVFSTVNEPCENVLLSPACASFDSFSDYKERGEAFERYVKELKEWWIKA